MCIYVHINIESIHSNHLGHLVICISVLICTYTYHVYVYICMYWSGIPTWQSRPLCHAPYNSRLLKIIGLFCKRAPCKRRYSAKETYILKRNPYIAIILCPEKTLKSSMRVKKSPMCHKKSLMSHGKSPMGREKSPICNE